MESVGQLLSVVARQMDRWGFTKNERNRPWYRGHAELMWDLCPSSLRGQKWSTAQEKEQEAFEEFMQKAPALGAPESIRTSPWNGYFLMRHYGAPTRLLDWTESVLIAAYFAVSNVHRGKSAAIWMLDPYELNHQNADFGRNIVLSPSFVGNGPWETEKIDRWLPYTEKSNTNQIPSSPVAVYPAYFSRRIENQKSSFTIHGSDSDGLTTFWKTDGPLLRIVIPAGKILGFRSRLWDMGIDTASVYPDLEGLGRLLAEKWGPRKALRSKRLSPR